MWANEVNSVNASTPISEPHVGNSTNSAPAPSTSGNSTASSSEIHAQKLTQMLQRSKNLVASFVGNSPDVKKVIDELQNFLAMKDNGSGGKLKLHLIAEVNGVQVVPLFSSTLLFAMQETYRHSRTVGCHFDDIFRHADDATAQELSSSTAPTSTEAPLISQRLARCQCLRPEFLELLSRKRSQRFSLIKLRGGYLALTLRTSLISFLLRSRSFARKIRIAGTHQIWRESVQES